MKKLFLAVFCAILFYACKKENNSEAPSIIKVEPQPDFIDARDGKVYQCIKIGDQVWMVQNLNYELPSIEGCFTFGEALPRASELQADMTLFADSIRGAIDKKEILKADGDFIITYLSYGLSLNAVLTYVSGGPEGINAKVSNRILANLLVVAQKEKMKQNRKDAELLNGDYSKTNGLLYTYSAALKAIPEGWKLPSDEDWKKLEQTLGMPVEEIDQLEKWRGSQAKYLRADEQGIGFNATLGGTRAYGSFTMGTNYINRETAGYYWSSTPVVVNDSTNIVITRTLKLGRDQIQRGTTHETAACQIRCIKTL